MTIVTVNHLVRKVAIYFSTAAVNCRDWKRDNMAIAHEEERFLSVDGKVKIMRQI